ncbi:MAG TPA: hypothetical protein VKA77_03855 [Mycobacterium sp.]|nr:hypothetical protein [Mycobacterium sp.]
MTFSTFSANSDLGLQRPQITDTGEVAAGIARRQQRQGNGDISDPVNKLSVQAIADLEQYWGKEFPNLYEKDFEPISGGYFAVTADSEAPPCTTAPQEVAGNAFYCSTEDVVAWDAQELVHFTG